MKGEKVPFRFSPTPRDLPDQWRWLPFIQRSVILECWRLCPEGSIGRMSFAGDPAQFLAMTMNLYDRRDLRVVVRAVRQLIKIGLLEVVGTQIFIREAARPGLRSELTPGVMTTVSGRDPDLITTVSGHDEVDKPSESFNSRSLEIEEKRSRRESAREAEPESQTEDVQELGFSWAKYKREFIAHFNTWNSKQPQPGPRMNEHSLASHYREFTAIAGQLTEYGADLAAAHPGYVPDLDAMFAAACDSFFEKQKRRKGEFSVRYLAADLASLLSHLMQGAA